MYACAFDLLHTEERMAYPVVPPWKFLKSMHLHEEHDTRFASYLFKEDPTQQQLCDAAGPARSLA
jgi:hypothetical protein